MYHHPIVLQKSIQTVSVFEYFKVIPYAYLTQNGYIKEIRTLFTQQIKGGTANFQIAPMETQQHRSQRNLCKRNDHHYRRFPCFGYSLQNQSYHCIPKQPQQETTLLSFPKARNHVIYRQAVARMSPSVMKLVSVIKNDGKQNDKDCNDGRGMNLKKALTPTESAR